MSDSTKVPFLLLAAVVAAVIGFLWWKNEKDKKALTVEESDVEEAKGITKSQQGNIWIADPSKQMEDDAWFGNATPSAQLASATINAPPMPQTGPNGSTAAGPPKNLQGEPAPAIPVPPIVHKVLSRSGASSVDHKMTSKPSSKAGSATSMSFDKRKEAYVQGAVGDGGRVEEGLAPKDVMPGFGVPDKSMPPAVDMPPPDNASQGVETLTTQFAPQIIVSDQVQLPVAPPGGKIGDVAAHILSAVKDDMISALHKVVKGVEEQESSTVNSFVNHGGATAPHSETGVHNLVGPVTTAVDLDTVMADSQLRQLNHATGMESGPALAISTNAEKARAVTLTTSTSALQQTTLPSGDQVGGRIDEGIGGPPSTSVIQLLVPSDAQPKNPLDAGARDAVRHSLEKGAETLLMEVNDSTDKGSNYLGTPEPQLQRDTDNAKVCTLMQATPVDDVAMAGHLAQRSVQAAIDDASPLPTGILEMTQTFATAANGELHLLQSFGTTDTGSVDLTVEQQANLVPLGTPLAEDTATGEKYYEVPSGSGGDTRRVLEAAAIMSPSRPTIPGVSVISVQVPADALPLDTGIYAATPLTADAPAQQSFPSGTMPPADPTDAPLVSSLTQVPDQQPVPTVISEDPAINDALANTVKKMEKPRKMEALPISVAGPILGKNMRDDASSSAGSSTPSGPGSAASDGTEEKVISVNIRRRGKFGKIAHGRATVSVKRGKLEEAVKDPANAGEDEVAAVNLLEKIHPDAIPNLVTGERRGLRSGASYKEGDGGSVASSSHPSVNSRISRASINKAKKEMVEDRELERAWERGDRLRKKDRSRSNKNPGQGEEGDPKHPKDKKKPKGKK